MYVSCRLHALAVAPAAWARRERGGRGRHEQAERPSILLPLADDGCRAVRLLWIDIVRIPREVR